MTLWCNMEPRAFRERRLPAAESTGRKLSPLGVTPFGPWVGGRMPPLLVSHRILAACNRIVCGLEKIPDAGFEPLVEAVVIPHQAILVFE